MPLRSVASKKSVADMEHREDDVLLKGYLKIRGKNLGFWARRFVVLRKTSSRGPCRLDKYTEEKLFLKDQPPLKTILLGDIETIGRSTRDPEHPHCFELNFTDHSTSRVVACESAEDLDKWYTRLNAECCCHRERSRSGSSEDEGKTEGTTQHSDTIYPVFLLPHRSTDIEGECFLQISGESVSLYDSPIAPKLRLLHWPISSITRYGKDSSKFSLEVGPQCLTGQGSFIFTTTKSGEIYTQLRGMTQAHVAKHRDVCRRAKARSMKKGLPRVNSSKQLRKSFTEGCLILPGDLYDETFLDDLDMIEDEEAFGKGSSPKKPQPMREPCFIIG